MVKTVIGIDEVGRGCWAGPLLVVAARQVAELPNSIKDSKKLSRYVRSQLFEQIASTCDIGEGWVMPAEIDNLGLTESMKLAVSRALDNLDAQYDEKIIIDGNINYCSNKYVKASPVIDADDLFPVVSAASIYAKVLRDKYMSELPTRYDVYEFDRHVGYGTKLHLEKLLEYGVSDLHRRSFKPIQKLIKGYS